MPSHKHNTVAIRSTKKSSSTSTRSENEQMDTKEDLDSPIIQACAAGETALVDAYLNADPELLNTPSLNGLYPEMVAAENGHWETMQLFYKRGVDINRKTAKNYNALHTAARGFQWPIVSKLIDNNAHGFDEEQQADLEAHPTPFYLVASRAAFEPKLLPLAERMINRGARKLDLMPMRGPGAGGTVLWTNAKFHRWKFVVKMMRNGARSFDTTLTDEANTNRGLTALWFAIKSAQWDLAKIMIVLGARDFQAVAGAWQDQMAEAKNKYREKGILEGVKFSTSTLYNMGTGKVHHKENVLEILKDAEQLDILNLIKNLKNLNPVENLYLYAEAIISLQELEKTQSNTSGGWLAYLFGGCCGRNKNSIKTGLNDEARKRLSDFWKEKFSEYNSKSTIAFEVNPWRFNLRLSELKFNCHLKTHPLLLENFNIDLTEEGFQTLLQQLMTKLQNDPKKDPNKELEEMLLNFLQTTQSFKSQLKYKKEFSEQQEHNKLKQDCGNVYLEFSLISERFRNLVGSDVKKLVEVNTKRYHEILDWIDWNNVVLEAQKTGKIQSTKKNAMRQTNGALEANEDRRKRAQQLYEGFCHLCEGGKAVASTAAAVSHTRKPDNLSTLTELFLSDYERGAKDMQRALQDKDLATMQAFMEPLNAHYKSGIILVEQLKQRLSSMEDIIHVLQEQNTKLGAEQQNAENESRKEQEKFCKERLDTQAAMLRRIEEDMHKQEQIEKLEKSKHERAFKRDQWKTKARAIHQAKIKQQELVKQSKAEQSVPELNEKTDLKTKTEQHLDHLESSTLVEHVIPQMKKQKTTILTQNYLASFKKMFEEEITLEPLGSESELEGYALLGKLAQLLEVMKAREGAVGVLAREVRNTLYHADPHIFSFSSKTFEVGRLVDMVLELLAIDWNDNQAIDKAVLPEYFVKLALYPREGWDKSGIGLTDYTVRALHNLIQKLDAEKDLNHKSKDHKNHRIQTPTVEACERHYKYYAEKLAHIRVRGKADKPTVVTHAVGYLEGMMGSYVKDALKNSKYKGLLAENAPKELVERGRAFRHNRINLNKLLEEFEESIVSDAINSSLASNDGIDRKHNSETVISSLQANFSAVVIASTATTSTNASAGVSDKKSSIPLPGLLSAYHRFVLPSVAAPAHSQQMTQEKITGAAPK